MERSAVRSLRKELKNLNEILNQNVESGNQVVDEIAEMINVWLVKRDNAQEYEHPTQKPITFCEKPMKRCTKAGDKRRCGHRGNVPRIA